MTRPKLTPELLKKFGTKKGRAPSVKPSKKKTKKKAPAPPTEEGQADGTGQTPKVPSPPSDWTVAIERYRACIRGDARRGIAVLERLEHVPGAPVDRIAVERAVLEQVEALVRRPGRGGAA